MSGHRVEITVATRYLQRHLDCDDWYVACHHEHLIVVHLTKGGLKKYALCFEATPSVEKGVYHGSLSSSISIVPLGSEHDLPKEVLAEMKAGLIELSSAHVC
jgi:hypothetical protein